MTVSLHKMIKWLALGLMLQSAVAWSQDEPVPAPFRIDAYADQESQQLKQLQAEWLANDSVVLGLGYQNYLAESPIAATAPDAHATRVDVDAAYLLGTRYGNIRLFGGLSYPLLGEEQSHQLNIEDMEKLRSARLGLDWQKGGFSGSISGQFANPELTEQNLTADSAFYSLELGWKSEQFGRIAIGAKNVLNTPIKGEASVETLMDLPEASGRVPYIRYEIDL